MDAPDYSASLREFSGGYRGQRERVILRVADVFDFYARLYANPEVIGDSRRLVAAVLAYFVVPEDVLPEEVLGPWGMLDDLYVAAHVYRTIRKDVGERCLDDAWVCDDDLATVMKEIYGQSRAALGKQRKEVLRMAGLG